MIENFKLPKGILNVNGSDVLDLRMLNVFIGPNMVGKTRTALCIPSISRGGFHGYDFFNAWHESCDEIKNFMAEVFGKNVMGHNKQAPIGSSGANHIAYTLKKVTETKDGVVLLLEEPEAFLHPDVVVHLAGFLVAQSEHRQIVITTHSLCS